MSPDPREPYRDFPLAVWFLLGIFFAVFVVMCLEGLA